MKLFSCLTPEVGANEDGADVVQLGAMPSSCRRGVGATPSGAELGRRQSHERQASEAN
jgi:hypothetical protein